LLDGKRVAAFEEGAVEEGSNEVFADDDEMLEVRERGEHILQHSDIAVEGAWLVRLVCIA
jgi:hypothetical protein